MTKILTKPNINDQTASSWYFFGSLLPVSHEQAADDSSGMEEKDPWLAPDKVYHILFCFSLTVFFSILATLTRHPFLRRHSSRVGSICSLLAGAAKEAADELGYFRSAGASAKDAAADVVGVLIASFALSVFRCSTRPDTEMGQVRGISLV